MRPLPEWIESVIGRRAADLRETDPHTDRDWARVRSRLAAEKAPAGRSPVGAGMRWARPAIAFAVLLVLILLSDVWRGRPHPATYATARGEHATVTLPDSSVVTLNHTSRLTVEPLKGEKTRRVTLAGEAYFVVRSEAAPFVVTTSVGSVRVLGTEFNVRTREGRMEVAVLRGSVRLSADRGGRDSAVTLGAGEISICEAGGFPAPPSLNPFGGYPGWMHGKFIFYRTPLRSACSEIESQFGVVIRVSDSRLGDEKLTGALEGNNVETALAAIARLTGTSYRHENGAYILY